MPLDVDKQQQSSTYNLGKRFLQLQSNRHNAVQLGDAQDAALSDETFAHKLAKELVPTVLLDVAQPGCYLNEHHAEGLVAAIEGCAHHLTLAKAWQCALNIMLDTCSQCMPSLPIACASHSMCQLFFVLHLRLL